MMLRYLALLFGLEVWGEDTAFLPPLSGKTGDPVAWIVLPGPYISSVTYKPLGEAVQKACSMPLWVAILGSDPLLPTPIPPEIGYRIDEALRTMRDQGLDLNKVKLFYGGHSLGSVFIQDHLQQYHGSNGPLGGTVQVLGQVLMAGFIQRKYLYPAWTYPVTTLTIGGELDGLARPTRLAEAYFHAKSRTKEFPVVIMQGMTHMQFASGTPPTLVKDRDLKPEITYEDAHAAVAEVVAPYFTQRVGFDDGRSMTFAQSFTDVFVQPIIEAYQEEGGRWMGTPVQFGGPGQSECKIGNDRGACPSSCPWAPKAQQTISSVVEHEGWKLNISNEFVDLASMPPPEGNGAFHLPKVTNDTSTNVVSITTYSECYWDASKPSWFDWEEIFDNYDTGFIATSAEEIGTKLASRQCTYILGAGDANTSFDVDDPNFCKVTNQEAYGWALERAGATTKSRYDQYGEKYVFGADLAREGGPLWLDSRLEFTEITSNGEKFMQVSSPMQKTEIDYWHKHFPFFPRPSYIPDPGCYHYCKLLSPARAMEWIYVDSLRNKLGLSSGEQSGIFV